jgi:outer membrane lipoprotein-sorting protein
MFLMNARMRGKLFLGTVAFALLLAVATVLLLAACGGSNAQVDSQAVLAAASTKMQSIKGFHFVYEVHKPGSAKPSSGLDISRITGDVNAEGHMQASVDAVFGGIPVTVGFVSMGETQYIQDPTSHTWQSVAAENSPVGTLSLSAGTITILGHITNVSYKGEASKGGVRTYHIAGDVAAEYVKEIAGSVDTTNTFPTDIYIGVNDSYVYEVDIYGAATSNETDKYWRSIVLSQLDTAFDIKAPQ